MAKKFEVVGDEAFRTIRLSKEAGVTIAAGDLVAMDSNGYAVVAAAASTAVAYCPNGAASAALFADVTIGNDFLLSGTLDENFAITMKGALADIDDTTQVIDVSASSTYVLQLSITNDAGTVGATSNVKVKINKPLF